jgi:hypothetical protein
VSTQSVDRPEPLVDTTAYNPFMLNYVNCESASAVELLTPLASSFPESFHLNWTNVNY